MHFGYWLYIARLYTSSNNGGEMVQCVKSIGLEIRDALSSTSSWASYSHLCTSVSIIWFEPKARDTRSRNRLRKDQTPST